MKYDWSQWVVFEDWRSNENVKDLAFSMAFHAQEAVKSASFAPSRNKQKWRSPRMTPRGSNQLLHWQQKFEGHVTECWCYTEFWCFQNANVRKYSSKSERVCRGMWRSWRGWECSKRAYKFWRREAIPVVRSTILDDPILATEMTVAIQNDTETKSKNVRNLIKRISNLEINRRLVRRVPLRVSGSSSISSQMLTLRSSVVYP